MKHYPEHNLNFDEIMEWGDIGHFSIIFHEKMTFNQNKFQQEPFYHKLNDKAT